MPPRASLCSHLLVLSPHPHAALPGCPPSISSSPPLPLPRLPRAEARSLLLFLLTLPLPRRCGLWLSLALGHDHTSRPRFYDAGVRRGRAWGRIGRGFSRPWPFSQDFSGTVRCSAPLPARSVATARGRSSCRFRNHCSPTRRPPPGPGPGASASGRERTVPCHRTPSAIPTVASPSRYAYPVCSHATPFFQRC